MNLSEAESNLKESQELMASKYCPLMSGRCIDQCIHYYSGKLVGPIEDQYRIINSKCKLWK